MRIFPQKNAISAKEVVKKFNISYHTVNYYTTMGLLTILGRKGNERFYDEAQTRQRLGEIFRLIQEGYPLHLIRKKIG
ncbi:MAG: MerR family transcriptional regulator [Candidatus Omnitrophica bacterium]|nr:MerR family transcriptional regulator [Candidatus Omnitrophota bacterium]